MAELTTSVVIATYNRGERIARTLDSVQRQIVPPDEIVVVDDGSTDHTADWIRRHYPAVSVVSVPNGGTSLARNRGAASARGRVLVFLDHDDELLPDAIVTLIGLLKRFPEARAAFADHQLKNLADDAFFPNHHSAMPEFRRLRSVPTLTVDGDARTYGRLLHRELLWGNLLQQPWAVYRDDFMALGGFDPGIRYCEDWDLYLRITRQHVTALTDRCISIHYIEGANLHRAAGQHLQHMKVLRKHISLNRWSDQRAVWTLRKRLANYNKALGDERRATGAGGAWGCYLKSLATWPFDPVVAVRCVTWTPSAIRDWAQGRGVTGR